MKNLFYTLVLSFFCLTTFAQDKIGIAVMPLTQSKSGGEETSVSPTVYEIISGAFVKAKRFNVIERSKLEALQKEKNLQKTEDYMDGKVVEQGKSLGAQYLILGNINNASETKNTTTLYGISVTKSKANVEVTIKVVDVATNLVIASENLVANADGNASGAMQKALNNLEGEVNKFLNNNFPVQFSLVEVTEFGKKGEARKVVISGGSGSGVRQNDAFSVVEKTTVEIDGVKKTRNKVIGKVRVAKVEDADFSQAMVEEGASEIADKVKAGVKLKVTSSN